MLDAAQPRAPGMGRYQSMRAYSRKDTYIDSSSSTTGLGFGWGTASHQLQLVSHVAVQDFHMSVDAADRWAASDSASGKVPYLRGCTVDATGWMVGVVGRSSRKASNFSIAGPSLSPPSTPFISPLRSRGHCSAVHVVVEHQPGILLPPVTTVDVFPLVIIPLFASVHTNHTVRT